MPIEGVSNVVRMPRLGKIRLGIKVTPDEKGKSPYPKAVDYFVCPEEVQKIFGEKPKKLEIMLPVEDPDLFAQQWLRCYSLTQGLVCKGSGETCRRKVDTQTGDIAGRDTKTWKWVEELPCNPEECEHYGKQCRRVMNFQFLLPQVPGLGVWQIDTTSFHSIVNINNMVKLLKGLFGRCSMIPLTLVLGPTEVSPPGMKTKTVYCMHFEKDVKLAELARLAQLPPGRALIPPPEEEEPPEDLFPREVLGEAEEQPALQPPPDNRTVLWGHIRDLLGRLKPKPRDEAIKNWFGGHFSVEVSPQDFDPPTPPEKFTEVMLDSFHNSLLAYEANLKKR